MSRLWCHPPCPVFLSYLTKIVPLVYHIINTQRIETYIGYIHWKQILSYKAKQHSILSIHISDSFSLFPHQSDNVQISIINTEPLKFHNSSSKNPLGTKNYKPFWRIC